MKCTIMSRANGVNTTPAADAALADGCRAFLAAAAELDAYSITGQGDGAAILQRYYRALADLTRACPQSPGSFTGRAVAAHLATRTAQRIVPRETRAEVAALMAEARP